MRRLEREFFAARSWITLASDLLVAEAEVELPEVKGPEAMWREAML
jgi:hypothetical protein